MAVGADLHMLKLKEKRENIQITY